MYLISFSQIPTKLFLFLIVARLVVFTKAIDNDNTFNVLNFGAIGDGIADDTKAFMDAWGRVCNAGTVSSTMLIPETKSFLVGQITFTGPCTTNNLNIMLLGTIIAPGDLSGWKESDKSKWLTFNGVNQLSINGPGFIDGRGGDWWNVSCRLHPQLPGCGFQAPSAILFQNCSNVNMKKIWLKNSPQVHITLHGTNNMELSWLNITAPGDSPNTDGIHLQNCNQVYIHDSIIGTGDDCISIGDYISNINITNIICGPGHGISVGSLGMSGNVVQVENITVDTASFIGTTNGVRIKTWKVGRGQARNISFSNLNFTNVQNPIIIDQNYCDFKDKCSNLVTGVKISDVKYHNAFGSSASKIGINMNCSDAVPCNNIILDTVILDSSIPGQEITASCNNAHGSSFGTVKPSSCLQP